jgi:hypothetical protein
MVESREIMVRTAMARNHRARHTLAFALLLLVLVAGLRPRATGDGGEYLALAFELGRFSGPPLAESDIEPLRERLSRIDGMREWDVVSSTHVSRFGT